MTFYSVIRFCTEIFVELKKYGYGSSESLNRNFTSKINHQVIKIDNSKTEQIRRKHLISLLYKDIDKVKSITDKQLSKRWNTHCSEYSPPIWYAISN